MNQKVLKYWDMGKNYRLYYSYGTRTTL